MLRCSCIINIQICKRWYTKNRKEEEEDHMKKMLGKRFLAVIVVIFMIFELIPIQTIMAADTEMQDQIEVKDDKTQNSATTESTGKTTTEQKEEKSVTAQTTTEQEAEEKTTTGKAKQTQTKTVKEVAVQVEGSGSKSDPYEIKSEEDLLAFLSGSMKNQSSTYWIVSDDIKMISNDWKPLDKFYGNFDGQGHTISGIQSTNGGLIGRNNGTIKNLKLEGIVTKESKNVGSLTDINNGTIQYCGTEAEVEGKGSNYIGGLVGLNSGKILDSYARGNVTGEEYYTGGLAGRNEGSGVVRESYASGTVTKGKGLVGQNSGKVFNSYYYNGNTGIDGVGFGASSQNLKQKGTYYQWDFDHVWEIRDSYPELNIRGEKEKEEIEGSGTKEEPYEIKTERDLYRWYMEELPVNGQKYYVLKNDIEMSTDKRVAIGSVSGTEFNGVFDGQGHTIKNLKGNNGGLFYRNGGMIKNLNIEGSIDITNSNQGLLCGYNTGTISGISVTGQISGETSSDYYVGGITGYNTGTISLSRSDIDIMAQGRYYVGGITGYNTGTINDCYAVGNITGYYVGGIAGNNSSNILRSYAAVKITGDNSKGGAIGSNSGKVEDVYYSKPVSGCNDTSKGIGLTKLQMMDEKSFENWDFVNIWSIYPSINKGYPFFKKDAEILEKNNNEFWYEVKQYKQGYVAVNETMHIYLSKDLINDKTNNAKIKVTYKENNETKNKSIDLIYNESQEAYEAKFVIQKGIQEITDLQAEIGENENKQEIKFGTTYWCQLPLKVSGSAVLKFGEDILNYNDILVKIFNEKNQCVYRKNLNDITEYEIPYLDSDETYKAVLYAAGSEYAKKENIKIKEGEKTEIDFTSIPKMASVKVCFESDQQELKDSDLKVEFFDKTKGKNRNFSIGTTLEYLAENDKIGYSLYMDRTAKRKYRQDSKVETKSLSAGENIITIQVERFKDTKVAGKVIDSKSGNPIAGVFLAADQKLNQTETCADKTKTDSDGKFTLNLKDEDTNISISKDGYVNQQIDIAKSKIADEQIIKMERTSGKIRFNIDYVKSKLESETEKSVENNLNPDSIVVYNETQKKTLDSVRNINSIYYAKSGEIKSGDRLRVTVTKKGYEKGVFYGTVNAEGDARINGKMQQLGGIQINLKRKDHKTGDLNQIIIFDNGGDKVTQKTSVGSQYTVSGLETGIYAVVVADNQKAMSDIKDMKELEKRDDLTNKYCMQKITVEDGSIADTDVLSIPTDEDASVLSKTGNSVVTNQTEYKIGDTITIKSEISLLDNDITSQEVQFSIPDGTNYVDDSFTLNGETKQAVVENGKIKTKLSIKKAVIRYQVKIRKDIAKTQLEFLGEFHYKSQGNSMIETIGRTQAEVKEITLVVPKKTNSSTIIARGIAAKNQKITIYDGNVVVGNTQSNKYGIYRTEIQLLDKGNKTYHTLKAIGENGSESSVSDVLYGDSDIEVKSMEMEHNGKTYYFNNLKQEIPLTSLSMNPSKEFNFKATFTDNENVDFVNVLIQLSNGNNEVVSMTYNESLDVWEGSILLSSSKVPKNVSIHYLPLKVDFNVTPSDSKDIFSADQMELVDAKSSSDGKEDIVEHRVKMDDTNEHDYMMMMHLQEDVDFTPTKDYVEEKMGDVTVYINPSILLGQRGDQYYSVLEMYIKQDDGKYTLWQRGIGQENTKSQTLRARSLNEDKEDGLFVKIFKKISEEFIDKYEGENASEIKNMKKSYEFIQTETKAVNGAKKLSDVSDTAGILTDELKELMSKTTDSSQKAKIQQYINELQMYKFMDISTGTFSVIETYIKQSNDIDKMEGPMLNIYKKILSKFGIDLKKELTEKETEAVDKMEKLAVKSYKNDFEELVKKIKKDLEEMWKELEKKDKETLKKNGKNSFSKDSDSDSGTKITDMKVSIDPSGYVYETFEDNRLDDVTATLYYEDEDKNMRLWDAEEYDQNNPLTTDADGNYAWDVPEGKWQVKYEKDGYETVMSDKLVVPPPQLDVNIEMVSTKSAGIQKITNKDKTIKIVFDKYIKKDSIEKNSVILEKDNQKIKADLSWDQSQVRTYKGEEVVKEISLKTSDKLESGTYKIKIADGMKTYAGVDVKNQETTYLVTEGEKTTYKITKIPKYVTVLRNGETLSQGDMVSQNDQLKIEIRNLDSGKRVKELKVNGSLISDGDYFTVTDSDVEIALILEDIVEKNIKCTVTFNSDGGSLVLPIGDVEKYSKISKPQNPVRQGYLFEGWYRDEKKTQLWDFDNDRVISNLILYAKWKQIEQEPSKDDSGKENNGNNTNTPIPPNQIPSEVTEQKPEQTTTPQTQQIKVSQIKLSALSTKIAAGKKIKLTADITKNASNKTLKWTTSNSKVATVDKNGVVTIKKKAGGKTVKITAEATDGSGKKAIFTIKVMKGVVKKVKISGKKTVKAGKTLKLKAKVTASKGANKKLKWTSSNPKYATVSVSGKVKASKAGKKKSVKITAMATDGSGKKATVKIKIK